MYSDKKPNPLDSSPEAYGRVQFEQEAGAGHAHEEYSAELAPRMPEVMPHNTRAQSRRDDEATPDGPLESIGSLVADEGEAAAQSYTLGIVALVMAAVSLFFLPAVLGPAAVVVGFAAFVRGNRTLGLWSMALGLLAVAAYYVLVPYYI
jgi:hypothetical protein